MLGSTCLRTGCNLILRKKTLTDGLHVQNRFMSHLHYNQVLQQPTEDQQEMRSILAETLLTVKAELDSLSHPTSQCEGPQVELEVKGEGEKALALLEQYAELLVKSVERRLDTKTWGGWGVLCVHTTGCKRKVDPKMRPKRLYLPLVAGCSRDNKPLPLCVIRVDSSWRSTQPPDILASFLYSGTRQRCAHNSCL